MISISKDYLKFIKSLLSKDTNKHICHLAFEQYHPEYSTYAGRRIIHEIPRKCFFPETGKLTSAYIEDAITLDFPDVDDTSVIGLASYVDVMKSLHIPIFDIDFKHGEDKGCELEVLENFVSSLYELLDNDRTDNYLVNASVWVFKSSPSGYHCVVDGLVYEATFNRYLSYLSGVVDERYIEMSKGRRYGTCRISNSTKKPFMPKFTSMEYMICRAFVLKLKWKRIQSQDLHLPH